MFKIFLFVITIIFLGIGIKDSYVLINKKRYFDYIEKLTKKVQAHLSEMTNDKQKLYKRIIKVGYICITIINLAYIFAIWSIIGTPCNEPLTAIIVVLSYAEIVWCILLFIVNKENILVNIFEDRIWAVCYNSFLIMFSVILDYAFYILLIIWFGLQFLS